ncbi:MAG: hypothetical protein V1674_05465 [Candidatus Omnitrophota bacterium]
MKKDYVQNRLAQVYFSNDRPKAKTNKFFPKKAIILVVILICSLIILAAALTKVTIFGTKNVDSLKTSISIASNIMPAKINYNFNSPFYDKNEFELELPQNDISNYNMLELFLKCDAKSGSVASTLKIALENSRNESGFFYIRGLNNHWQHYQIPLDEFKDLTDKTQLKRVSFVLESWNNPDSEEGVLLLDNLRFFSKSK